MDIYKDILGHGFDEYVDAVVKKLKEKYSLSFNVESLGGAYGTHDNTTLKARCFCTEGAHEGIRFTAEIKKDDLNDVKDTYLNIHAAKTISEKIASFSPNKAAAYSILETRKYCSDNEIADTDSYLDSIGSYRVTTHLFVEDDALLTPTDRADLVYSIGEKTGALGLKFVNIAVWFVSGLSDDIKATFIGTEHDRLYDAYLGKEYVTHRVGIRVTENGLSADRGSLTASLEKGVG